MNPLLSTSTDETSIAVAPEPAPAGRWIEGLSGDMALADVLEVIFRQRWQGVLHYLPAAVESDPRNVEQVHKLRVSSRRLAAVLDVLTEALPQAPRKILVELAGRIRRSCGKARDLDVRRQFLESLLPHASVEDAGAIELLCEMTVERRARVQKKLRRKLPRLERKVKRAGVELLESLAAIRRKGRPASSKFDQIGVRILRNEMTALWSRAEENIKSAETLHQLRIACKHLRYATEVFMPALPESFRDEFYPQLEHVQDLLGAIHDSAQATRVLRRRRRKWQRLWKQGRWNGKGPSAFQWSELRAGLDAVLSAYAQQGDRARTDFLEAWPGFAGESFRFPVEQLLSGLAVPPSSGNNAS
jgi:CHAD domain-containing protein